MAALAEVRNHSISIERLTKKYGGVTALDGVSLEIGSGRFVTLLGPSGSGKTTLLMAIAGFVEPTSGILRVDDRVITHLPPERRNFGMVFQGYALFPHLTVAANVAFPLRIRKLARAELEDRVRRTLDLVQLTHLADRYPRQLSGGQQQRVALARSLVFEPDVLLLDEPLSALDKNLRADLQWELKELHRRLGMTFVYVTHDQEEALSMSDEIAIIRNGGIVQKGDPETLYERPLTHFVAGFLGKSNFIHGRVRAAGATPRIAAEGFEFEQAVDRKLEVGEDIVVAIRPEKLEIALEPSGEARNRIRGALADWNYHGARIHCRVETELGPLHAEFATWRSRIQPARDQPVWLEWEPDAGVVVEDDR